MWLWSAAMAAGISNELFWNLTPREVIAVLERKAEEEKAKYLRTGVIASTIVNMSPVKKKGHRAKATDFFRERPKPGDFMDVEQAATMLNAWAKSTSEAKA